MSMIGTVVPQKTSLVKADLVPGHTHDTGGSSVTHFSEAKILIWIGLSFTNLMLVREVVH